MIAVPVTQGFLLAAASQLQSGLEQEGDPRRTLLLALLFILFSLPLEIWAWLGLFRAGSRACEVGRAWRGRSAQVWATLGFLGMSMGGSILAIAGYQLVALVLETRGLSPARVVMQGDQLVIEGDIAWSTADEVKAQFDAGIVRSVRVNSRGGAMGAGIQIAKQMNSEGIQVLVIRTRCASACTALLEGAPHRALEPGATIAAHAPFIPGGDTLGYTSEAGSHLRASYRRAGIDEEWISKALATPFNRFYAAPAPDLLRFHVIQEVIGQLPTEEMAAP